MSQITKPIALDETLQDVVTAIQGITQGGMIVSTGTVGSSTQPAYIDGGVPRAIEAVDKVKEVRNAYGDANTLIALNTVNFTEIYNGSHTPAASTSESYMYLTGQGGDANNGGVQIAVGAYPSTNNKIFYRRYNGGSWGDWKQLYGIQTGTPTNPHANLTYVNGKCEKSGNVVNFWAQYRVETAFTPTYNTVIGKLPWAATATSFVTRTVGPTSSDTSSHTLGSSYVNTSKELQFGFGDYPALTTGNTIAFYGTYLTND